MSAGIVDPQGGFEGTLDDLSAALNERDTQEADCEADRLFGATLREAIAAAHGEGVARAVRRAFTEATRPATVARAKQDRIHKVLTARLDTIAGDAS